MHVHDSEHSHLKTKQRDTDALLVNVGCIFKTVRIILKYQGPVNSSMRRLLASNNSIREGRN